MLIKPKEDDKKMVTSESPLVKKEKAIITSLIEPESKVLVIETDNVIYEKEDVLNLVLDNITGESKIIDLCDSMYIPQKQKSAT